VETSWRRKDVARLFVRLSARMMGYLIEVVVEDQTRLRVLQERLAQAQRMEAVGRFASEVADTCGNLLSDIHENGQEWLAKLDGGIDARQRGERMFEEVRRAAGLLKQLEAVGEEQARTPMLVDLNTVIRDLEPVLKRVAGGDVDIQLRDTASPLNVDVGADRVERLLVNVAGIGRGRMPSGGVLKIELGTSVVDRHFAAKHPNVRLGLHALITVTEVRRTDKGTSAPRDRERATPNGPQAKPAPRAGLDFGTLHELVSDCGGHLWMQLQGRGEMVAKIRLPLSIAPDQPLARTPATRPPRERLVSRLFHS
jgi:hypothetical protein